MHLNVFSILFVFSSMVSPRQPRGTIIHPHKSLTLYKTDNLELQLQNWFPTIGTINPTFHIPDPEMAKLFTVSSPFGPSPGSGQLVHPSGCTSTVRSYTQVLSLCK